MRLYQLGNLVDWYIENNFVFSVGLKIFNVSDFDETFVIYWHWTRKVNLISILIKTSG